MLPVASTRHTLIFLGIFALLFVAGLRSARATPAAQVTDHLTIYAGLIAMQGLLLFFVKRGIGAKGYRLRDLAGPSRNPALDLALGVAFAVVMRFVFIAIRARMGVMADHASALMPRGALEAGSWIVVSIAAGVCEEMAFRGYLQRQFTACTRSGLLAAVLQSAVFAGGHGYQGIGPVLLTFVFGIAATALARWRGNLHATMIGHALTDIVGGLWR